MLETIARMRDINVFMLGNAGNLYTNPYFLYFDLQLPYNNDIKLFKDNLILLHYMKNEEYRQEKKKSKIGRLISNTTFEDYAINNKQLNDNKNFVEKKQGTAKFSFAFVYKSQTYGVWCDYSLGKIYVSYNYMKTPYFFACTLEDHTPNTMLINQAKKYRCWKNFIDNFKLGNVRFENNKIKYATQELIKIMLT